MKYTEDIHPSAVLCLSLGLFVGTTMFMPQQQKSAYISEPLTMDATLVDVDEGRLLERLPGDSHADSRVALIATHDVQATHKTSQELGDLFHHSRKQAAPGVLSDSSLLAVITVCVILAAFAAYTDVLEISAEEKKPNALTTTVPVSTAEMAQGSKCLTICHGVIRVSAIGLLVLLGSAWKGEVSDLVANSFSPRRLPDTIVLIVLASCALFGAAILKVDFEEIAEEAHSTDPDVTAPSRPNSFAYPPRKYLFTSLFIIAVLVAPAFGSNSYAEMFDILPHASINDLQEQLQDFVRLASNFKLRTAVISDSFLMLVFAVCVTMGMAIMRVDVNEMVEQSEHASVSPCNSCQGAKPKAD